MLLFLVYLKHLKSKDTRAYEIALKTLKRPVSPFTLPDPENKRRIPSDY